jgi:hypothetical protein
LRVTIFITLLCTIDNTISSTAGIIPSLRIRRIYTHFFILKGAGIAQSVQRLATGWTAEGSQFESRYGQEFSLLHFVRTSSGAHPASYPMGTGRVLSPGVKRPRLEADHSPPTSAEVKKNVDL